MAFFFAIVCLMLASTDVWATTRQCDINEHGPHSQEAGISLLQSKLEVVKSSESVPEKGSIVMNAFKEEDEARAKPASSYKASLAKKDAPTEHILFSHHKAGVELTVEAARLMQNASEHLELDANQPRLQFTGDDSMVPNAYGWALSPSDMHTERPACWLHVVRNPFEMLVSGYLYHKADSEPDWEDVDFGRTSDYTRNLNHAKEADGLDDVFKSSRSGAISDLLPDAKANETYPEYLKRVNFDAGLIAEFVRANNTSLASMLFTSDFLAESQACSIEVCHNEFSENCNATWQRVFNAWQLQGFHDSELFRAATSSCAADSYIAAMHSSHAKAENITHPPEYKMVKRLRELDSLLLNGKIAAMEKKVGCPVSGTYAKPHQV